MAATIIGLQYATVPYPLPQLHFTHLSTLFGLQLLSHPTPRFLQPNLGGKQAMRFQGHFTVQGHATAAP
jgi:hypothetical protein